jgi:hypothetical protein
MKILGIEISHLSYNNDEGHYVDLGIGWFLSKPRLKNKKIIQTTEFYIYIFFRNNIYGIILKKRMRNE